MKPVYPVGQMVYQRVCHENVGIVTAHIFRERGAFTYLVMWSKLEEGEHMESELTDERDYKVPGSNE